MQAVLLTEDVDIIVQHVTGMLQSLVKRHTQPQAGKASSSATLYGDKAVSAQWCLTSVALNLNLLPARFAQQAVAEQVCNEHCHHTSLAFLT